MGSGEAAHRPTELSARSHDMYATRSARPGAGPAGKRSGTGERGGGGSRAACARASRSATVCRAPPC
jgi:hypothetical protein